MRVRQRLLLLASLLSSAGAANGPAVTTPVSSRVGPALPAVPLNLALPPIPRGRSFPVSTSGPARVVTCADVAVASIGTGLLIALGAVYVPPKYPAPASANATAFSNAF